MKYAHWTEDKIQILKKTYPTLGTIGVSKIIHRSRPCIKSKAISLGIVYQHKVHDLTGLQFGKWKVLSRADGLHWNCICDCGKTAIVNSSSLVRGLSRSCGCITGDLTGKKFGKLTVLQKFDIEGKKVTWECQCDCGRKIILSGNNLTNGRNKSCGCLKHDNPVNFRDLTGQRFGRLVAISSYRKNNRTYWKCLCDCGNNTDVLSVSLIRGLSISCGCYRNKISGERNRTHGKSKTRIYRTWCNMRQRCYNKKNIRYNRYGGRGIKICEQWKDNFEVFYTWAISNGYDDNLSIDRINSNGNYEPSNCRWSDDKAQARNKTVNHLVTFNGQTMTIADWSEKTGLPQNVILKRLNRGWPIEKTLTSPLKINQWT